MTKTIFSLFLGFILIISCQRHEVIKTHGVSYLDKREKLIHINKSNKNDTVLVLGQPATKGMTNDNMWIYIERTQKKGNVLKLGKNYLDKSSRKNLPYLV